MIVIVYVLDSLRPDFLSCYGYPERTSPNIDSLAQDAVVFTNAFAQSTWTKSSAASLLSSTYPSVHEVFSVKDAFPESLPTLPEQLKKAGFKTIAISAIGNVSTDFGFGKGFDVFVELYKEPTLMEKRTKIDLRLGSRRENWRVGSDTVPLCTSEDINQFLFPMLPADEEANLFILVWSIDTHGPYLDRASEVRQLCGTPDVEGSQKNFLKRNAEQGAQHLKSVYQELVRYNDYQIGSLIRTLKNLRLFEQTLFILTSDHGEIFGEHGVYGHRKIPYDELIRIPLVIKFPNSQFVGRVAGLVQQIDLAPTILSYLNLADNDMVAQGKNLLPLLTDGERVNEFVFAEFQRDEKSPKYLSLRNLDYKYMEATPGKFSIRRSFLRTLAPLVRFVVRKRYLFSLKEKGETVNVIGREKRIAGRLRSEMNAILRKNREIGRGLKKVKKDGVKVDEEVAKQLSALGYFD